MLQSAFKFCLQLQLALLHIGVGIGTRVACSLLFLCFAHIFIVCESNHNNHCRGVRRYCLLLNPMHLPPTSHELDGTTIGWRAISARPCSTHPTQYTPTSLELTASYDVASVILPALLRDILFCYALALAPFTCMDSSLSINAFLYHRKHPKSPPRKIPRHNLAGGY
jgi:hypothetical protein